MNNEMFVRIFYPKMKTEGHSPRFQERFFFCRNGRDFMWFSEGATKAKAWKSAKEIIEEKKFFGVSLGFRNKLLTIKSLKNLFTAFCGPKGYDLTFGIYFKIDSKEGCKRISIKDELNGNNFLELLGEFSEYLDSVEIESSIKGFGLDVGRFKAASD